VKNVFFEKISEGRFEVEAVVTRTHDGINICIGGGERPHIGTVVISQPRESLLGDGTISCTTSIINVLYHKDDGVAVPLAEMVCKAINQLVVVTAGLHIENAVQSDIDMFKSLTNQLGQKIVKGLKTGEV